MTTPYRSNTSLAREILSKKDEPTVETPFSNPEAQQVETHAERVMRQYCSKSNIKAQVKGKIIDNA